MLQHPAIRALIFLSYVALAFGDNDQKSIEIIRTEDGDLFECIDINQQPTLSHPLLKNHKIQMKPSSYPSELHNRSLSVVTNSMAQLPTISCPSGTIPILQGRKGDIIHSLSFHAMDGGGKGELAVIKIVDDIYGSRVSINVYEPKVKETSEDFSASWVVMLNNQNKSHLEAIGAGSIIAKSQRHDIFWNGGSIYDLIVKVWPRFHGDNFARFHITWMDVNHDDPCFDHRCPGFVQVSPSIGLGGRIRPVSIYNGPQYTIDVLLFKDPKTKNWWLAFAGKPIGYWPSSLFAHMKDKATKSVWGGHVSGPTVQLNFPEMGSGHFAWEGFGKAAFVRHIKIVDENNKYTTPNIGKSFASGSRIKCYPVDKFGQDENGMHVYYGGPGGCNN